MPSTTNDAAIVTMSEGENSIIEIFLVKIQPRNLPIIQNGLFRNFSRPTGP